MGSADVQRSPVGAGSTAGIEMIDRARRFADERLMPAALETDRASALPVALLDELRDLGLYGISSPVDVGGSGLTAVERHLVIEALAGGCLTTTFVWQQHAPAAAATATCAGPARRFASDLALGRARAGVAFAHLLRAGAPMLSASTDGDGWILDGTAPFVTGWGLVDVVLVAARHADQVIWLLIDAVESGGISTERLRLAAVDASSTHIVRFDRHRVAGDRFVSCIALNEWLAAYRTGLRANGSLALGVTGRACRLLGPGPHDHQLDAVRHSLDTADVDRLPAARADATLLCLRVTASLVASQGGGAVTDTRHAQRLAREAMFLLVQGQNADIRSAQLERLAAADPGFS